MAPDQARAACIIGWPVEHSRSPLIHNYWLKHYGIAGEYRREGVPPPQFADFVKRLSMHGYVGANVTVPHKEAALAIALPDDRAERVGAANTLWLDDGVLRSTNTDVEGFLDNLDVCAPDWDADLSKAVVLGAGGAARAVVYALKLRGFEQIVVANRTPGRADALRERFGREVRLAPWDDPTIFERSALLINATTLGMAGQPELAVEFARLSSHAVVADLVYVPLQTALLRDAKTCGLRTADGLGMLLYQAVRGFTLWFGKKPEVTAELRALVEADLAT
jgi:shikimate dehydrogenase